MIPFETWDMQFLGEDMFFDKDGYICPCWKGSLLSFFSVTAFDVETEYCTFFGAAVEFFSFNKIIFV